MKKILVTTDMSGNSKAGIRFAIKLAASLGAELIILHVHHLLRASFWSESEYELYLRKHTENTMEELQPFVKHIYNRLTYTAGKYRIALHRHFDVPAGIMEFAAANDCSYIVTTTRGAGMMMKILGTNASALIQRSQIPVITVPAGYRAQPLTKVLYASDMLSYDKELPSLVAFAAPLQAAIELLHLRYGYEPEIAHQLIEQNLRQRVNYPVHMVYRQRNTERSVLEDIEHYIAESRPSVLVLFTHQDRSFAEQLFMPGNARRYAFHPKVPLLTFRKEDSA